MLVSLASVSWLHWKSNDRCRRSANLGRWQSVFPFLYFVCVSLNVSDGRLTPLRVAEKGRVPSTSLASQVLGWLCYVLLLRRREQTLNTALVSCSEGWMFEYDIDWNRNAFASASLPSVAVIRGQMAWFHGQWVFKDIFNVLYKGITLCAGKFWVHILTHI